MLILCKKSLHSEKFSYFFIFQDVWDINSKFWWNEVVEWDPLNSVSVTKNKIGIYSINVYIINRFIGQRVYLLGTLQNGLKMSE